MLAIDPERMVKVNKKEKLKKVVEMCGGQIKEKSYAPDRIVMITQPEKDR